MVINKKWSELSTRGRCLVAAAGVIEVTLLLAALIDLKRRPADEIRGSKRMWTALAFVNLFGPIAYFTYGRRR